jgi:peptide/nickel transport system permease protein
MRRYIIRRILQAILLLFLMSVGLFLLIHALPGGPAAVIAFNPHLTLAARQALIRRFGLDKPLYLQYFYWITAALRGNFGFSYVDGQAVTALLGQTFGNTLELFGSALVFALILAVPLGVISAIRHYTITDYLITVLAYFGISMPIFWFGLIVQLIFGVQLHWLPVVGQRTYGYNLDPFDTFIDYLQHLILPMCVLSLAFIAGWSRYMRSSMLETIQQDYIRTAKAKGLGPVATLVRHALRNALIPLVTVVAIDFGSIAGGAAVTETVFAWPGMGRLFIDSLTARDYPVLLAMLLLSAVVVILFNLIADILYAVLDPRIRYS